MQGASGAVASHLAAADVQKQLVAAQVEAHNLVTLQDSQEVEIARLKNQLAGLLLPLNGKRLLMSHKKSCKTCIVCLVAI